MTADTSPAQSSVLIVTDVQNDFCPGGALGIEEGDTIIPAINRLARTFPNVIATQDWHPPGHISFASSHQGKQPQGTIELESGTQILWPDHCVQGTPGADLHRELHIPACQLVIRKGYRPDLDSYSAFFENDHRTPTGLGGYLRERGLSRVFLTGLATDFCVRYSALDGRKLGLDVFVIDEACKGIDVEGSLDQAWAEMDDAGVVRISGQQAEEML